MTNISLLAANSKISLIVWSGKTVPVGLDGEFISIAFVRGPINDSISLILGMKLF